MRSEADIISYSCDISSFEMHKMARFTSVTASLFEYTLYILYTVFICIYSVPIISLKLVAMAMVYKLDWTYIYIYIYIGIDWTIWAAARISRYFIPTCCKSPNVLTAIRCTSCYGYSVDIGIINGPAR